MFSPAVEKKNSLRFFKYQHLFSVHLDMRLFFTLVYVPQGRVIQKEDSAAIQ